MRRSAVGYVLSLVAAVAAGFLLLDAPAMNILAFAFVVWLGGWFAHDLNQRRR